MYFKAIRKTEHYKEHHLRKFFKFVHSNLPPGVGQGVTCQSRKKVFQMTCWSFAKAGCLLPAKTIKTKLKIGLFHHGSSYQAIERSTETETDHQMNCSTHFMIGSSNSSQPLICLVVLVIGEGFVLQFRAQVVSGWNSLAATSLSLKM